MKTQFWLAAFVLLPACASAPPTTTAPEATGRAFNYVVPAPPSARYEFLDTSSFDIQAGPLGNIKVSIGSTGSADITFSSAPTGLQANVMITRFAGSMTNSTAAGGPSATEADIQGPAIVTVSSRGEATVTTSPKLTNSVQRVGVNPTFFRRFFVRLPKGQVQPGATWVDTISTSDDNAGTKVSTRDIITATFVRDTTVNGRSVALITTSSQRTLNISGVNEGVEVSQKLSGTSTGAILWDANRNLLVERSERTELSGTFDLPQMNMTGLPVSARGVARLVLR